MAREFYTRQWTNGLTLLGQRRQQVSSAAMTLLVPAGAAYDQAGAEGAASVLCEWCLRGAGDRDTRRLNDALDSLGCQRHETVYSQHIQFSSSQLGRNLPAVLALYADIVRRPQLPEPAFGPCRDLVQQDLASLEDEPAQKCSVLLREKFFPRPLGRCVYGTASCLQSLTGQTVRRHWQRLFSPRQAILAVAGNIDWEALCDQAEKLLGDWQPSATVPLATTAAEGGVTYLAKQSAQSHIALAHRSVVFSDSRYYAARMAEMIWSGGMSSRLFTEVREKRGLVYTVSTSYHSLKDHAGMFTYAGTTPQRAQETLEVTVAELRRLAEGIEEAEMARARTQLKTAIVMQGESTSARASALASDWYYLGRLRSLQEISQAIDNVTADQVLDYLRQCPAADFTALVIGPAELDSGKARL